MKRSALITLILCYMTLTVPAQNNRTVNTNRSTTGTTNPRNTTPRTTPRTQGIPIIPTGLFSAQELEYQRIEAIKAIELTSQLLSETSVSAKNSLNRLNLLIQQLLFRKKVIAILGQEISEIDRKIKTMSDDIEILNRDLEKTKENYAKSMQNQQLEHRSTQHKMLLILSADNLSQTYRRMRYLREYADWQKEEGERIMKKQTEILQRKGDLEKSRKEKEALLSQRENENKKLGDEEKQQQQEVKELSTKQKELQRLLDQKRKEADALNREIERLIAEDIKNSEKNISLVTTEEQVETREIKGDISTGSVTKGAKGRHFDRLSDQRGEGVSAAMEEKPAETVLSEAAQPVTVLAETESTGLAPTATVSMVTESTGTAAKATASKPAATKDSYVLLGSEVVLSKEFESNRGKLPFPLTGKYTIVSSFGEQQHQELSYVRTNNNGIDIQTTAGSDARAIFRGIVTRVFVMPGFNNNVIIRHGDYLTVYSNLSNVNVKAGDVVAPNQTIGKIFTDTSKGNETILHFQLWKERTKLNPAVWIK